MAVGGCLAGTLGTREGRRRKGLEALTASSCCMPGRGVGRWSAGDEKQLEGFKKGCKGCKGWEGNSANGIRLEAG